MQNLICDMQLKELDANCISFDKPTRKTKIVNGSQERGFLELFDDLKEGESCSLRTEKTSLQCVIVEIDWWNFRNLIGGAERLTDYVSVTRKQCSIASVLCIFQANTLRKLITKDCIKLKLNRLICTDEIEMVSEHRLSGNKQFLTVFNTSFDDLFKDLQKNVSVLSDKHPLPVFSRFPTNVPCPIMSTAGASNSSSFSQIPQKEEPQNIATYEIPLTKSQVTYLIGKGGSRIESIRDQSKATIKILPISKKLTIYELSRPDSVLQAITVTGDWFSVAVAMTCIESHLNLHKISPGHQF